MGSAEDRLQVEVWDVVDEGFEVKMEGETQESTIPSTEKVFADAHNIDVYHGANAASF